eukprot:1204216-Amphidinium_carterae.1
MESIHMSERRIHHQPAHPHKVITAKEHDISLLHPLPIMCQSYDTLELPKDESTQARKVKTRNSTFERLRKRVTTLPFLQHLIWWGDMGDIPKRQQRFVALAFLAPDQ